MQRITKDGRESQLLNAAKGCGEAIEAKMAPMNSIAAALGIGLSAVMELHSIANSLETLVNTAEWHVDEAQARQGKGL